MQREGIKEDKPNESDGGKEDGANRGQKPFGEPRHREILSPSAGVPSLGEPARLLPSTSRALNQGLPSPEIKLGDKASAVLEPVNPARLLSFHEPIEPGGSALDTAVPADEEMSVFDKLEHLDEIVQPPVPTATTERISVKPSPAGKLAPVSEEVEVEEVGGKTLEGPQTPEERARRDERRRKLAALAEQQRLPVLKPANQVEERPTRHEAQFRADQILQSLGDTTSRFLHPEMDRHTQMVPIPWGPKAPLPPHAMYIMANTCSADPFMFFIMNECIAYPGLVEQMRRAGMNELAEYIARMVSGPIDEYFDALYEARVYTANKMDLLPSKLKDGTLVLDFWMPGFGSEKAAAIAMTGGLLQLHYYLKCNCGSEKVVKEMGTLAAGRGSLRDLAQWQFRTGVPHHTKCRCGQKYTVAQISVPSAVTPTFLAFEVFSTSETQCEDILNSLPFHLETECFNGANYRLLGLSLHVNGNHFVASFRRRYHNREFTDFYISDGNKTNKVVNVGTKLTPYALEHRAKPNIAYYALVGDTGMVAAASKRSIPRPKVADKPPTKTSTTPLQPIKWKKWAVEKGAVPAKAAKKSVSPEINSCIRLCIGDISACPVDAIVTAANKKLAGGTGVDAAVHGKAGPNLLQACSAFPASRGVRCPVGSAKLTDGYNLNCKVLHAVGPDLRIPAEKAKAAALLRSTYTSCLATAVDAGIKSVAFPCISTGVFGYKSRPAATVAAAAVRDFLDRPDLKAKVNVVFCLFSKEDEEVYKEVLPVFFPVQ